MERNATRAREPELEFDLPTLDGRGYAPLGVGATLGLGGLVLAVFVLTQLLALLALGTYTLARSPSEPTSSSDLVFQYVVQSGFYLAIATSASGILGTLLVVLIAKARRGPSLERDLALRGARIHAFLAGLGAVVVFEVAVHFAGTMLGRPPIPEYFVVAYLTAHSMPFLWISTALIAPAFEELFFRGFLFTGLQHSRFGPWGAAFLTSSIWTVIHLQYDLYDLGLIFLLGLMLGAARVATGSLYVCVLMHVCVNLLALVSCAWFLREMGVNP